jgi:hypothetical protein
VKWVFDDLLIGNFMKVTLHGDWDANQPLYRLHAVSREYGDNGGAHTARRAARVLQEYRRRGFDYLRHRLEAEALQRFRAWVGPGTPLWSAARRAYWWLKSAPSPR